jgi:tetrahydromethanopterin S-methyltransferase subunit E
MKIINVIGLVFLSAGVLIISGWSLYKMMLAIDVSPVIKWGIVSIVIGIIIILISLINERSKESKNKDL